MGASITPQQNSTAAEACMAAINGRFGGSGIETSVENHSNAKKYAFVRIMCPPQHWIALAKWMKYDLGVNYCSMVTGTHFPDGSPERGWEVAYHFLRQPVKDQTPNTCTVHDVEALSGMDIPDGIRSLHSACSRRFANRAFDSKHLDWSGLERKRNLGFSWYQIRGP